MNRRIVRRLCRAIAYALGRLTAEDAQTLMLECRQAAGWHPLLVLSAADTLEDAHETYVYHPELPRLVTEACFDVEHKWTSFGDDLANAREWALRVAERHAREEGLSLTRLDAVEQIFDAVAAGRHQPR